MNGKQKLAIGTLIVGVIAVINLKVALDFIQSYDSKVASIEAIAASNDEKGYRIDKYACSISEKIDVDGYITVGGRKIKVGGLQGEYEKTWENAARDCLYGGMYVSCTAKSCDEFYKELSPSSF